MTNLLESLNWRYATKKYDATRKISSIDLEILKEATKLSVSSMGLQPYKVLIVENPELRAKLQPAAYGQSAITDASQPGCSTHISVPQSRHAQCLVCKKKVSILLSTGR